MRGSFTQGNLAESLDYDTGDEVGEFCAEVFGGELVGVGGDLGVIVVGGVE